MIADILLKKGSGVPSSLKLAEPAVDLLNKILYIGLTEGENGGSDYIKLIDENKVKELISKGASKNLFVYDGNGANSIVFNSENNIAISDYSVASGYNTLSGLRGYYYTDIDFSGDNPIITLSSNQGSVSSDALQVEYVIGDIISMDGETTKYYNCSTIIAINKNKITVDALPFNEFTLNMSNIGKDDYSLWVFSKPTTGVVDFGYCSHSEGEECFALQRHSHAEGRKTRAMGEYSHAEGNDTVAYYASHAEGISSKALGFTSHAEGYRTSSNGLRSHSEGSMTSANGSASHAEGITTVAEGDYSHVEGLETIATGEESHAEGWGTEASGRGSHTEGKNTVAQGSYSHAEGEGCVSLERGAHAEGLNTKSFGSYAHSEGYETEANGFRSHSEGYKTIANADSSHTEGYSTYANGLGSHAEGCSTKAYADRSHAEGYQTRCDGVGSHVEGFSSSSIGYYSHSEGGVTRSEGLYSHAEGLETIATGEESHAEGWGTKAIGRGSHTEGKKTIANESYSHAEGEGTQANSRASHVEGKFNIIDSNNKYAHILGNGQSDYNRSNGHTIDWDGNGCFAGSLYVNTQYKTSDGSIASYKKVATEEYVDKEVNTNNADHKNIINMINNLHYYCNKDITYDINLFTINDDILNIDCSKISDGVLVIPYNIYKKHTSINVVDAEKINKIIIPRGMKLINTTEMTDEDLVSVFTNLQTIVRIHEDGAVLSYNVTDGSLN